MKKKKKKENDVSTSNRDDLSASVIANSRCDHRPLHFDASPPRYWPKITHSRFGELHSPIKLDIR